MNKKKFLRKLLLAACFTFITTINVKAQTINDAFASIADSTGQTNFFSVEVSDTTNISEVEVRLGNELAATDILLLSFVYDSQPSAPYTYSRKKNVLKLGIGTIAQNNLFYGEVRLKYPNGSYSSPFQFVSN